MDAKPTGRQIAYVNRIVNYFGEDRVKAYVQRFYKDAKLGNLTKEQAQKIITGLSCKLPMKALKGVRGFYG